MYTVFPQLSSYDDEEYLLEGISDDIFTWETRDADIREVKYAESTMGQSPPSPQFNSMQNIFHK